MPLTIPSISEVFGPLTGPYNNIVGTDAVEHITGTDGADYIEGLDSVGPPYDYSVLDGGAGSDFIEGGAGLDILIGGEGDDLLIDYGDSGELYGGDGDDYMIASDGGFNLLVGGAGTDVMVGNAGEDWMFGGDDGDLMFGGEAADFMFGGFGNDQMDGGDGDDVIEGNEGNDVIFGGAGMDFIVTHLGSDIIEGGADDDVIFSRSDAGQPISSQDPEAERDNPNDPIAESNDILNGGEGADSFVFQFELDATVYVASLFEDGDTGILDWQGIAEAFTDVHGTWVQGIGTDVIGDFNLAEGDEIKLSGYSVAAAVQQFDSTDDGNVDSTIISVFSDAGALGNDTAGHNGDSLGTIIVEGALLTDADITVENDVYHGAFETYDDLLWG